MPEVMIQSAQVKILRKELAETKPTITNLEKINPNDFDTYEDAFFDLFGQTFGVLKEPLHYVSCAIPWSQMSLRTAKRSACSNFHLKGMHMTSTIMQSTESSRHFLLTLLDGLD